MVSTENHKRILVQALKMGARHYLIKPINKDKTIIEVSNKPWVRMDLTAGFESTCVGHFHLETSYRCRKCFTGYNIYDIVAIKCPFR